MTIIKFWPKRPLTKVHGDLTIDNIIYSPNKIRFIDWELYGTSNEIWGYDLVYLVISSIFFNYYEKKSISQNEIKKFKILWVKLKSIGINTKFLDNPILYFRRVLRKKKWLKVKKNHPGKIYIYDCDFKFNKILKKIIHDI